MLVLRRRPGKEIDLTLMCDLPRGTRLRLVICDIVGNQVRIGIDAPTSVIIDRHEVTLMKAAQA